MDFNELKKCLDGRLEFLKKQTNDPKLTKTKKEFTDIYTEIKKITTVKKYLIDIPKNFVELKSFSFLLNPGIPEGIHEEEELLTTFISKSKKVIPIELFEYANIQIPKPNYGINFVPLAEIETKLCDTCKNNTCFTLRTDTLVSPYRAERPFLDPNIIGGAFSDPDPRDKPYYELRKDLFHFCCSCHTIEPAHSLEDTMQEIENYIEGKTKKGPKEKPYIIGTPRQWCNEAVLRYLSKFK